MPFRREYDPDELIDLLRTHDGLTTSELAEAMDAALNTTWYRCVRMQEEGRLSAWRFGAGQRSEVMWYALDEE